MAIFLLAPLAALDASEIKLAGIFTDHAVLQRDLAIPIWGTADAGTKIVIEFADQKQTATTDAQGRWRVLLDPMPAAGNPLTLTVRGKSTLTISDVLVGEVWVCSGQSNMGWPLASRPGAAEAKGTENPKIRLFNVPARFEDLPQSDLNGQWSVCGPDSLVNFSAVAYYFGRDIQQSQRVPVGLIHASYGGSGVAQWTSAQALATEPELQSLRDRQLQEAVARAKQQERLKPEIERYQAAVAQAKRDGTTPPMPPRGMIVETRSTSRLYNGMIHPLIPYGIRGVIWYQGEANVSRAGDYRAMFSTLIRSWRHDWNEGEFPFLFVQIAPYQRIVDRPQESDLAALREAQLQTSRTVPHTGMAVITDWGHETDIHVKQKRPVGERLALLARGLIYGEKVEHSGPRYEAMSVADRRVTLTFSHVGSGLVTRRLVLEDFVSDSRRGEGGALHVAKDETFDLKVPIQGFTIAGADQIFVTAQAEIQGNSVIVWNPQVERPVAVRFGWADYPAGNLFNREGLPASPFRTDSWPLKSLPRVTR
jgi:sialate O-acetylesterase